MLTKRLAIVAFLTVFLQVEARAQTGFEQKVHEIYQQSYSKEISDELWSEYTSGLGTRTYAVAEGDTLWDLSLIFFGDGNYWSKIWSYNQELTNPHLLKVGQEIAFFSGSLEQPPGFVVGGEESAAPETLLEGFADFKPVPETTTTSETSDEASDADSLGSGIGEDVVGSRLYPGAPSIPPPRDPVKPAPDQLPSTFKDFGGFSITEYNFQGISLDLRPPVQVNPLFIAQHFLYSDEPDRYPRIGTVLESENGNTQLGLNDVIYIKSDEALQVGDVYTIMSYDYKFDRNGIYGSVIRYAARVKITRKLEKKNIFTGEIFYSLSGVQRGSWLSREPIPTFQDDPSGRPSSVEVAIIGGGEDNSTRIFGGGDIVFLQGGSRQGLRTGDILGVYKNRTARFDQSETSYSPAPIGQLKIFRVENNLASAFVVESSEELIAGDRTGTPARVTGPASATEKADLNDLEKGLDFKTE